MGLPNGPRPWPQRAETTDAVAAELRFDLDVFDNGGSVRAAWQLGGQMRKLFLFGLCATGRGDRKERSR